MLSQSLLIVTTCCTPWLPDSRLIQDCHTIIINTFHGYLLFITSLICIVRLSEHGFKCQCLVADIKVKGSCVDASGCCWIGGTWYKLSGGLCVMKQNATYFKSIFIQFSILLGVERFMKGYKEIPFLEYSWTLTPASNLPIARLCFKDVGSRGRLGQRVLYRIPTAVARIPPTTTESSGSLRARWSPGQM